MATSVNLGHAARQKAHIKDYLAGCISPQYALLSSLNRDSHSPLCVSVCDRDCLGSSPCLHIQSSACNFCNLLCWLESNKPYSRTTCSMVTSKTDNADTYMMLSWLYVWVVKMQICRVQEGVLYYTWHDIMSDSVSRSLLFSKSRSNLCKSSQCFPSSFVSRGFHMYRENFLVACCVHQIDGMVYSMQGNT